MGGTPRVNVQVTLGTVLPGEHTPGSDWPALWAGLPAAASARWSPPPPPLGRLSAPPALCPPSARRSSSRSGWRPPGGPSRWRAAASRLRGARFQPWPPSPRDEAGRTRLLAARPPSLPPPAALGRPGLTYWARFWAQVRANHCSPTHSCWSPQPALTLLLGTLCPTSLPQTIL